MNYLSTNVNWEEFFIQEALELEEKMKNFDHDSLNKPKLLIALESEILSWEKYEAWFCSETGCASFKVKTINHQLESLIAGAKAATEIYSNHEIWNSTLQPLLVWDNQVFVMGLSYPPKLMGIENHVFILTPPRVLAFFAEALSGQKDAPMEEVSVSAESILEGIDFDIPAPKINFNSGAENSDSKTNIWDFISERHDEYSFEAKKHFSAYMVLKVVNKKTKVFKMDSDLEKDGVNSSIFEYNLNEENPFQKVFNSGQSESFSLTQLGITIKNYKYACITALQRGDQVMGFLLGFKNQNLSEKDQVLLEDLAKESA